jgi:hypothetical protein
MPIETTVLVAGSALKRQDEVNPVVFAVVRQADGTFDVEASDGGPPEFLISFRTEAEAEAWIAKLKGMIN